MSYIVISPDGDLRHDPRPVTADTINAEVGEPGFALVRLYGDHTDADMYGFVNDCGHVLDPPLPRNPIGACLLWCLGATAQAYAGPVVITGWVWPSGTAVDLDDGLARMVTTMHRTITNDLGSPDPSTDLAGYAEWVRASPAPVPVVLSGDDARAYLRGTGREL